MRIFKGCLMLLAFFFLPLLGTEAEKILTIKELVSKIKNAPDDEKRVLINQLKGRLKEMSKENRTEAMRELQKSFKSKKRTKEDDKTTREREEEIGNILNRNLDLYPEVSRISLLRK